MTQCEAILAHLAAGNTITPVEAYALCGSLALHSRIAELRGRGCRIDCEIIRTSGGKNVGRYTLNEAIAYG